MTMTKIPPQSELNTGTGSTTSYSPTTLHHSLSGSPHSSGSVTPNTLDQDRELLFDSEDINAAFGNQKGYGDLPSYEASSSARSRGAEPPRCAILPDHPAVWTIKNTDIKLSAFVAAILLHQGIISTKDLDVYIFESAPLDQGPSDPITGIFKSVHGTVGGIVQGLVDYPVEITKIVQADGDVAKGLATDFALDSNKGISRIVGTALKAPMDVTMNLSRGFGNVPKLYGDETVREVEKVDGVLSGLSASGKGFGLSLWDGVTGLVTQPVQGAEEGGVGGFFMGLGKGIGGAVFKPISGAIGIPANAFKGVYEEISRLSGGSEDDKARAERLKQGNEEWGMCSVEERQKVLGMWHTFHGHGLVGMQETEAGKWN